MQAAVELALEHAQRADATRIHRIRLRVGRLSGVVPEALEFAFDAVIAGTIAEGARLEIEAVGIVCFCLDCQLEFATDSWFCECPSCGRVSDDVRQGDELELDSLELS